MSTPEHAVEAITTLISAVGVWVGFFWLYRDYRVDLFRHNLFGLREELFDLARSGAIGFDDAAYGTLRSVINGMIRLGHRLTCLQLLTVSLLAKKELRDSAKRFEAHWTKATADLHPDTREALRMLRGRLHYLVLDQVIFTSPLLMLTLVPAVVWVILLRIRGLGARFVRGFCGDARVDSCAIRLDWGAYVVGSA